ncbi:MAG: hypothetical protein IRY90_20565 [Actinomadura rubrobrunea]|nr:hypothetical protein [Actinomadura rubrobrunea]
MTAAPKVRYDPFAALGARLFASRMVVDYTARGLKVYNPALPGCCAEVAHPSVLITCRRRADDGGRTWFFTSWGEALAPVDEVDDAAMYVVGYLVRQPQQAHLE